MAINSSVRRALREGDLETIFVEELGWEPLGSSAPIVVVVDGTACELQMVAEKKHVVVLAWRGAALHEYSWRLKVERQVARLHQQHIIVFTDGKTQVWQWVRRELGQPLAVREHRLEPNGNVEALWRKLDQLAVSIQEEELLDSLQMDARVRRALDVESVTKKFYDGFKTEHAHFLDFIKGIPDQESHDWYASVMLNRLMFIYFVQSKKFLNGDERYLQNKLEQSTGNFYSDFLCPLFFSGFAKQEEDRSEAEKALLGSVPYLNGGLFLKHKLEHENTITISDAAWKRLFDFFDKYQWQLDERPRKQADEINPDVLGFIFEKYINQKQMGAYYTKEDITGYISRNTILPWLFEAARPDCTIAFEGEQSVWRLLANAPDTYIYPAVKHGLLDASVPSVGAHRCAPFASEEEGAMIMVGAQRCAPTDTTIAPLRALPPEIAAGIDDVSRRGEWNKPAPADWGLPTEIWREVVARRQRFEEVREKLARGQVRSINDLVTLNLDIEQFAQHVVESAPGPDLLRALWKHLEQVSVLDPTCGSGAFLFAALNVLKPLYSACLARMESLIEDTVVDARFPEPFADFKAILGRVELHANRDYFVLKSIIVNNLFGVDIMHEATEICRLRLFLKLVAQVEHVSQIEPLPDIDFNIRAGNTLVGFANFAELEKFARSRVTLQEEVKEIGRRARIVRDLAQEFRTAQLQENNGASADFKKPLSDELNAVSGKANLILAELYGIETSAAHEYSCWLKSHEPFHWFVAFYDIIETRGGFDVIIGNPPYLEVREIDYELKNYRSLDTNAIHAMCMERSVSLRNPKGALSMIVPLSLVSTQRMKVIQEMLEQDSTAWYANYSWRPAKLFDTVNRALTIFVTTASDKPETFSTTHQKWTSDNRESLMSTLSYTRVSKNRSTFFVPKIGAKSENILIAKLQRTSVPLSRFTGKTHHRIYYRTTGGLYWKVFTDFAPDFVLNGKSGHSSRETSFTLDKADYIFPVTAFLSSDIFWWWYTITTNCRDLNPYDIQNFPVVETALADKELASLGEKYLSDLKKNSVMLVREQKQTGTTETQSFKIQKSKPIIDEIDRVLASHYGFTDSELDFIINYDVKYRMGRES